MDHICDAPVLHHTEAIYLYSAQNCISIKPCNRLTGGHSALLWSRLLVMLQASLRQRIYNPLHLFNGIRRDKVQTRTVWRRRNFAPLDHLYVACTSLLLCHIGYISCYISYYERYVGYCLVPVRGFEPPKFAS